MKRHLKFLIVLLLIMSFLSGCQSHSNISTAGPTIEMTPVEVVEQHLDAERTNDWDAWLATLTEEKKEGFTDPDLYKYLISLEVNEIRELTDSEVEERIEELLNSENNEEINLSEENFAFVYVDFTVESDTTKSSFCGTFQWVYTLFREKPESPWLIQDWGVGHFDI